MGSGAPDDDRRVRGDVGAKEGEGIDAACVEFREAGGEEIGWGVCEGLEFCFGLVLGGRCVDLRGLREQQQCETRVMLGEGKGRRT